jgi:hypothetical protein
MAAIWLSKRLFSRFLELLSSNKAEVYKKCLRRILRIFWPVQISNNGLWTRTNQIRIDLEIERPKWGWLGRTSRKPPSEIASLAMDWNPQGRPKVAWRRTVLEEAKIVGKYWNEIKHTAGNTVSWKNVLEALCPEMEWWDYTIYVYIHKNNSIMSRRDLWVISATWSLFH